MDEPGDDLDRALLTGRRELLRILAERAGVPSSDRKTRALLRSQVDAQADLLRTLEARRKIRQ